ncbi:hypothetical protein JKP88DRAFT_299832 [Tribonema minus]|uniref:RRM domain-containing protein n=1 Tax=Tribonema minus TaxID=303371 RepID=A0A835ZBN5_9STRA|nr:hypothetical protein JKP88DRAFT_299832 [Tribonema minus]
MDALPAAACLRASVSSSSSSSSSADQDFDIDGVLVEAATVVSITSVPCEREIFVGGMPRQRSSAHAVRPSLGGRGGADGFIWHADLLRALSARYGVIRLIDMNVDTSTGLPRGFAFVEFEDAWCALMCRMGLAAERLIKGTLCTVDWSKGTTAGADRHDAAPADLPAAVAPAEPAAMPPLSAAAAAARPCAGVDSIVSDGGSRGGGGSGRGGRGRGGGAKPRRASNGAFCTAGTRGSSAHSVEAFDTAPQAEAWRARNERIARRLRAWAWRVCDPIAGSGDGGWLILDAHRTAAAGAAAAAAVAAAASAAAAADASAAAGAAPAAAADAAAAPRAARVPAGAVLREMAATALRHAAPPYAHAAAAAADASAGAVAVGHAWGAAACCSAADAAATGGRRCAAVQANCCGAAAAAAEAPVFVDGSAKARTAAAAAAHMQRALEAALAAKCGGGSSGCGGTRGSSSSSSGGGSSGYDTAPLSAATSGAGTPSMPPLHGGACGALLGAACGSSGGCARSGGGSGDAGVLIR